MVDVFELLAPRADEAILENLGVERGEYLLATAHRAGNVDDPARLRALVDVLTGMPLPVVLPLHPRTRARLEAARAARRARRRRSSRRRSATSSSRRSCCARAPC